MMKRDSQSILPEIRLRGFDDGVCESFLATETAESTERNSQNLCGFTHQNIHSPGMKPTIVPIRKGSFKSS